ncbi:MAG: hypothetical protein Q7R39_14210 [Dehalococcoidia bacterium]|nr:hypothetical protein [Dehalococcoidia bacterium]
MRAPGKLTDLEKARLFWRALNSYTMAEAALRHNEKLKAPFRPLVDRLVANWETTETRARSASTEEAAAILRKFMESLDERMVQGQKDIEQRHSRGEKTGPLFLAWGLFYLFKTRAQDLAEELAAPVAASVEPKAKEEEPLPVNQSSPDEDALREFQMALGLGP